MEFINKATDFFNRGLEVKLYALIAYILASTLLSAVITSVVCIQARKPCPVTAPVVVKTKCPKLFVPSQKKRVVNRHTLVPTTDGRQF
jgi:hypothetical protein